MKNQKLVIILISFIKIDSGEYVQIIQMRHLERLFDEKIEEPEWLDCVYNLIEDYDDGGRTAAFSRVVIE